MCKQRKLTEEPLINGTNRSIGERSIQTLEKTTSTNGINWYYDYYNGSRDRKESVPRNSEYHERAQEHGCYVHMLGLEHQKWTQGHSFN